MTWRKREIMEMAREAGMTGLESSELLENFEAFAKLVREDEREACAKMFDEVMPLVPFARNDQGVCLICGFTPKLAAAAIRAR